MRFEFLMSKVIICYGIKTHRVNIKYIKIYFGLFISYIVSSLGYISSKKYFIEIKCGMYHSKVCENWFYLICTSVMCENIYHIILYINLREMYEWELFVGIIIV